MAERLTQQEVARVANLARLKLTPMELQSVAAQLGRILEYVQVFDELNTDDVQPMAHAVEQSNVFRDDIVIEPLSRSLALSNAPKTDNKFFLVPQVIEH